MAVTIVKHGVSNSKIYRGKCVNCGCIMEGSGADVKHAFKPSVVSSLNGEIIKFVQHSMKCPMTFCYSEVIVKKVEKITEEK